MSTLTIKTKDHGTIEFTLQKEGGHVRMNGKQICKGGSMVGSTLTATSESFEKVCRAWHKAHLKACKEYGYAYGS